MRILVLGSGAREHALAWKLSHEPDVSHVICAPGNAGIARSLATAAGRRIGHRRRDSARRSRAHRSDRRRTGGAAGQRPCRSIRSGRPARVRADAGRRPARNQQGVREGLHAAARRADRALPRVHVGRRRASRRFVRASSATPWSSKPTALRRERAWSSRRIARPRKPRSRPR